MLRGSQHSLLHGPSALILKPKKAGGQHHFSKYAVFRCTPRGLQWSPLHGPFTHPLIKKVEDIISSFKLIVGSWAHYLECNDMLQSLVDIKLKTPSRLINTKNHEFVDHPRAITS